MHHILSRPGTEALGWNPAEFWATGHEEIGNLLRYLDDLGFDERGGSALDFGCGIGRLCTGLAPHFKYVLGVDISIEMVRKAQEVNVWPNVRYRVCDDLRGLQGDRDLIYSAITLQHMPAAMQATYVQDFVDLLAPDGVAVFQLPEGDPSTGNDFKSMYGTPREAVEAWVEDAGGKVVDVVEDAYSGGNFTDWRYAVTR